MSAVSYYPKMRAWALIRKLHSPILVESFKSFGCELSKCDFSGVCSSCVHRVKIKPNFFPACDAAFFKDSVLTYAPDRL